MSFAETAAAGAVWQETRKQKVDTVFSVRWTTKERTSMYSYCLKVILCQVVLLYKLLFSLRHSLECLSPKKKMQLPLKPSDQSFSMLLHIRSRTVCSHIHFLRIRTYVGEPQCVLVLRTSKSRITFCQRKMRWTFVNSRFIHA